MSLVRQCDCPDCHEDEYGARLLVDIDEFEQWATFGGRDVCQGCLEGRYCRYWQPYIIPPPSWMSEQMRAVWEKALYEALRTQPIFRRIVMDS